MKKRKEITRRIRIIKKMLEDHGIEYSIGEEEWYELRGELNSLQWILGQKNETATDEIFEYSKKRKLR
nr:MAG TPA: Putative prokaryotic signal transducing protein [Caudoviricetes sp.]